MSQPLHLQNPFVGRAREQQAIQDAEQALAISLPMNLPWSDLYKKRIDELRKQQ